MLVPTQYLTQQGTIEPPGGKPERLTTGENNQVYCGLDCMLTLEIHWELEALPTQNPLVYSFERALQAPYLSMMQKGFAIDQLTRGDAARGLRQRLARLQQQLDEFARVVWGKGLNPGSYVQLQDFFYKACKFPPVYVRQKGESKLSTNREALEKLSEYLYARPFVNLILAIRDAKKQLDFMEIGIDLDGRFRSSYNIAGTETGRPSSSQNPFGTGGNAQNIAQALRHVMVADPGHRLAVVDLEQVEARDVGFFCGCLFNDWTFLDSCERGDLHTNNARLIWPELPWTGEAKADRALADQPFYREFSYRDMAKRGSHLSNYSGTAWTMARSLKIPLGVAEDFQARYCRGESAAYPCLRWYWQWVAEQLQTVHYITTPFGRTRHFFGRQNDDTTLREAIAFVPQSTTADRMNLGLLRVWRDEPRVQLLAQTYDSITFQYLDRGHAYEAEIISNVLELIQVELRSPGGRLYTVPGEAKVGWNWGPLASEVDQQKALESGRKPPRLNPNGLVKFNPTKPDHRGARK
jgi:DNA polymerase I-like protein with 3'-5' exonuclease and polymerase domains